MTHTKKIPMQNLKHRGFTMIETLVSLVIISIGVLGFALLQIESLKATKTATERSKAIHFATDMLERIRANKNAIASYATANIDGPGTSALTQCADPLTTPTVTAATTTLNTCTGAEMAAFEIRQWRTSIEDPIFGFGVNRGEAGIQVTGTGPWTVVVSIRWLEKSDTQNYVLTTAIN